VQGLAAQVAGLPGQRCAVEPQYPGEQPEQDQRGSRDATDGPQRRLLRLLDQSQRSPGLRFVLDGFLVQHVLQVLDQIVGAGVEVSRIGSGAGHQVLHGACVRGVLTLQLRHMARGDCPTPGRQARSERR
jgi:hypothetical protein